MLSRLPLLLGALAVVLLAPCALAQSDPASDAAGLVRRLHEGVLAAGEAHGFTVSAQGLPSTAYLLLVTGEDFRAVQKVTALR